MCKREQYDCRDFNSVEHAGCVKCWHHHASDCALVKRAKPSQRPQPRRPSKQKPAAAPRKAETVPPEIPNDTKSRPATRAQPTLYNYTFVLPGGSQFDGTLEAIEMETRMAVSQLRTYLEWRERVEKAGSGEGEMGTK